ncbi:hypothetical protein C7974DRAFT_382948 [Boeremia exigua]|uniref:uncharacterized protein n=1 Tax=Boeremia exigua TaxID=749465 RepID=UPI001E8DC1AD|nr:uncharacterized protein C7974DRAFT_382948 [Boeremia exigua]KAH6644127.1 hypothetical protein C7974DRAFT_382948 [Boeremia exigua]
MQSRQIYRISKWPVQASTYPSSPTVPSCTTHTTNTMSAISTKDLKIIVTGLTVHADIPAYFRELYGTPQQIQSAIDLDEQRIREAGVDVTSYQIDDADTAGGLQWLDNKLRSEKFDGIILGSGLRLIPTQTELFENAVNVCRRANPDVRLMFNAGPGTNWDTLQRNLENLK